MGVLGALQLVKRLAAAAKAHTAPTVQVKQLVGYSCDLFVAIVRAGTPLQKVIYPASLGLQLFSRIMD